MRVFEHVSLMIDVEGAFPLKDFFFFFFSGKGLKVLINHFQ